MAAATKIVDRKVYYAGQTVFKMGEIGDRAYLVQEGLIEIVRNSPEGEKVLGTIGPGGIFGEMALIDAQPRMATARAQEQTTVIIIGQQQFTDKLARADPFIKALLNIFVRNIREMAKK